MTEKNIYISYLRVIATVFVILIHASTGYLNHFDQQSFDWNYANIINSFSRCSVPIFVIISGALLIHKDENTSDFYKKRLPKLLYPFLFWTIIYLVYYFGSYTNFEKLNWEQIFNISKTKILSGANAHLWYLYMITGLYLAIPYLRKLLTKLTIREIEYFLIFWLIAMILTNKNFQKNVPKIDLTFFSGYIGYLVLGYYISIKELNISKIASFAGYIVAGLFTTFLTLHLSIEHKKYDSTFYSYLLPNTAIAAACLFIWAKKNYDNKTFLPKWVMMIDKYSFGIYLAHIIPLNYIHPIISKQVDTWLVVPLATLATIILSIIITFVLRKIPYGKYVSG